MKTSTEREIEKTLHDMQAASPIAMVALSDHLRELFKLRREELSKDAVEDKWRMTWRRDPAPGSIVYRAEPIGDREARYTVTELGDGVRALFEHGFGHSASGAQICELTYEQCPIALARAIDLCEQHNTQMAMARLNRAKVALE